MVIAAICGALFFKLPLDAGGAYSRSGLIYFAMLFFGSVLDSKFDPELIQAF